MLLSTERLQTTIVFFDVTSRLFDHFKRRLVAGFVVVAPGTHPVVPEEDAFSFGLFFYQRLDQQSNVEARALPGDIDDIVAVNFSAERFLVDGSCDRNHSIRMKVIDVAVWNKRMQRSIDRTGSRIEVEDAVAVHWVHPVLNFRLWPPFGIG